MERLERLDTPGGGRILVPFLRVEREPVKVMAAVELESLTKYFGNAVALDSLSLTIAHGSLVCLLGPSGCGKTTTLRLVAGFLDPDQGTIRVGGRTVSEPGRTVPPERRGMSMIFQSYALWPHMTIAENVAYGLKLRRLDRAERERRVAAILDVTRLGDLASRYPHELSGGQQQRAALARALVVEPETLLLDEPLSNLDANLREEMRFEIRRLHDAYKYTTIYVTHDQGEAMTTADTIVVMNRAGSSRSARRRKSISGRARNSSPALSAARTSSAAGISETAWSIAARWCCAAAPANRPRRGNGGVGAAARHQADPGRRRPRPSERRTKPPARSCGNPISGSYRDYLVALLTAPRCASPRRCGSMSRSAEPCDCIFRRNIAARWRAEAVRNRDERLRGDVNRIDRLSAAFSAAVAAAGGSGCGLRRGAGADRDDARPARQGEGRGENRLVHLDRAADRGEDRQGLRGGASRHRRAGRAQRLRAHRAAHRAGAQQQYPRRRRRRMFRHDGAVRLEESRAGSLPTSRPMSRNTRPTIAIRTGFTRPTGSRCRRSSTTRSSSSPRTRRKASPICSTRNGKARSSRRIPAIAARS